MSLPKRHLTSTVVAVAGCSPVTFRAWRNRNGLFPETQTSVGWNEFSEADIAAVRMVVVLTNLGVGAQIAIDAAMKALPSFEQLFELTRNEGELGSHPLRLTAVLDRSEDEPDVDVLLISNSDSVASALGRVANGAAIVVDLFRIAVDISEELRAGNYPTVMTPEETRRMIYRTAAAALRPDDETSTEAPDSVDGRKPKKRRARKVKK